MVFMVSQVFCNKFYSVFRRLGMQHISRGTGIYEKEIDQDMLAVGRGSNINMAEMGRLINQDMVLIRAKGK